MKKVTCFLYPAGSYEIEGFPIAAGESFTASVQYAGQTTVTVGRRGRTEQESVFTVIIANTTTGTSFTVPASYTTVPTPERSSAEWIAEAPSSGRGVLPVADFGTINFSGCYAASVLSGGNPAAIGSGLWTPDPITMEDGSSGVATPSALSDAGSVFWVVWSQ